MGRGNLLLLPPVKFILIIIAKMKTIIIKNSAVCVMLWGYSLFVVRDI